MNTAVANPPDQNLRQYLLYSIIMHGSLAVVIVVTAYIQYHGKAWGGVGGNLGGAKVNLVSAAGIPMPKESVVTESKAVDPTKGLHKEEPPKPPEPKTDATKIPKFDKEKPLPPSRKSRTLETRHLFRTTTSPTAKAAIPICRRAILKLQVAVPAALLFRARAAQISRPAMAGTSKL